MDAFDRFWQWANKPLENADRLLDFMTDHPEIDSAAMV